MCHCLLLESASDGLVLIDTGFGADDCRTPERFDAMFRLFASPVLDERQTAANQIRALGLSTDDVRHIVVTHLDLDHAGGLAEFPNARVHVHAREKAAAEHPASFGEKRRYVAAQWAHGPRWQTYADAGDDWFGFTAVRQLEGLTAPVVLVPLFGHTHGHSAVAVEDEGRWLLHAGDGFFHHRELVDAAHGPMALRLFQKLFAVDDVARRDNATRLRTLHRDHRDDITIFCAHDPVQLEPFVREGES